MVQEHDIFLSVISAFQFWVIVLGFLFVCQTWVNINAHFYSEGFIVLVEMFLMIDEHFELILECVNEIFCLIELLLSVPGVLPERRGFEDGYDF